MENLPATRGKSENRIADMTIGELLLSSFLPVKVLHPLGTYGRLLGLEPTNSKAPNPEFLVRLLTGHASHQAYIRHEAGSQYKNLENLIRGKHKLSPTTKLVLTSALGIAIEDLEKLEGSSPDGPLLPEILAMFQIFEGLPTRVMAVIFDIEVPCPCCGNNLLDDVDVWWERHAPGMGRSEYYFAERLLKALTGAGLIERFVSLFQGRAKLSLDSLENLAHPSRHPIGHWLVEAQEAISCNSLATLATTVQLRVDTNIPFSHGRLKKWSAGQDVMPLEAGTAIAKACGQSKSGMRRLIAARTIALVADFLAASVPGTTRVSRKGAREIVYARLEHLGGNSRIAVAAIAGRIALRAIPFGNTEAPPMS